MYYNKQCIRSLFKNFSQIALNFKVKKERFMGYKICPSCGDKNDEKEILCKKCMADLTGVEVVSDKEEEIEEKTLVFTDYLTLVGDGFSIVVKSGDIIGRQETGVEHLKNFKTVSRKHARFFKEGNKWYIEDLNSTNGTFVNNKLITSNQKFEIKNGDIINLSSQVAFKVKL